MLQVDFKIGKEEDPSVAKMLEHAVVTMFIVDSMIDVKNYKSPFISRIQDDFFLFNTETEELLLDISNMTIIR